MSAEMEKKLCDDVLKEKHHNNGDDDDNTGKNHNHEDYMLQEKNNAWNRDKDKKLLLSVMHNTILVF